MSVSNAAFPAIPQTDRPFYMQMEKWRLAADMSTHRDLDCSWTYELNVRLGIVSVASAKLLLDSLPSLLLKKVTVPRRRTVQQAKSQTFRIYVFPLFTFSIRVSAIWRHVHKLSGKYSPAHCPVLNMNNFFTLDSMCSMC